MAKGIPGLFIHAKYQNVKASYLIEDDIKAGYMKALLATILLVKND